MPRARIPFKARLADRLALVSTNAALAPLRALPRVRNRVIIRVEDTCPRPENTMSMTRLVPMLPVKNVRTSIDFYRKLGFIVERHQDHWGWAMLAFGDCRLMLDQSINTHPSAPRQSVVYLYPDDVAAYHHQVQASGLDVPDLGVTFYGMTEFRLDDPDGNRLWIGQSPAAVTRS